MANVKLSPEVRAVLERCTIDETSVKLPPGQLDRPLYLGVKQVLEFAGGWWVGGHIQAFKFHSDPRAKLGLTLETGLAVDEQKKFQAFYTPPELAAEVAMLAMVKGKRVLEPSAGQGALVKAVLAAGAAAVDAIELNPENQKYLDLPKVTLQIGDFMEFDSGATVLHGADKFDRIVMNPPFTKDQDIAHVTHALDWLAPGGMLVAIMLDNLARPRFQIMERYLHHSGAQFSIRHVPAETFKDTPVRTIILKVKTCSVEPVAQPGLNPSAVKNIQSKQNENINMNITIPRTELVRALAVVKSAANPKATLPILANVYIVASGNSIALITTDLDVTLRTTLDAEINVGGQTTVRAALLHDLAKSFKADHVTLSLNDVGLKLIAGDADFDLPVLDAAEFPPVPALAEPKEFDVFEYELRGLLQRTAFARSTDTTTPAMAVFNGALIRIEAGKRISVAACDGRRLAFEQSTSVAPKLTADLNLPGKAVSELLRLLNSDFENPRKVNVKFNASQAQFTFGNHVLVTKLIDGSYPNYRQIIPEMKTPVTVNRPELLACAQRVALISDGIVLSFNQTEAGSLTISSNPVAGQEQLGRSVESLPCTGTVTVSTTLATKFLIEALEATKSEELQLFPSNEKPIALQDPNSTWLGVIAALKK